MSMLKAMFWKKIDGKIRQKVQMFWILEALEEYRKLKQTAHVYLQS